MKVVIAGGGIGGLTAALMASKMGYKATVLQSKQHFDLHSFGGGIGLWPPSQMVMERLGVLSQLQNQSLYMPDPYYLNHQGKVLGHPSSGFSKRYKIICLERNVLSRVLMNACKREGVELLNKTTLENFKIKADEVQITLGNGQVLHANNLIGADGINSLVRTKMLEIMKHPKIQPHHCGYAYFRAVVDVSKDPQLLEKYHTVAFQSWGQGKRFGYVPLKSPKTFWFAAIPIGEQGLQKFQGSHILTNQSKQWLLKQFAHWKGKLDIKRLIQISDPEIILRTDIRKMQGITKFPWATKDGKVILMGDAANATAPNIAQGAGLAIQSAWDLFSMIDFRNKNQGLEKYLQHRKHRAYTVQSIADTIAYVGQLTKPASSIRDFSMYYSTKLFNSLQNQIFQQAVRYSTGGSNSQKHWVPFLNTEHKLIYNVRKESCLLGSILGSDEFSKLPQFVQDFRSSMVGTGKGTVTVSKVGLLGKMLGMPSNMQNEPFGAYVDLHYDKNSIPLQKWTRVFGEGKNSAKKYETFHQAGVDHTSKTTGLTLTETLGQGSNLIKFGYDTKIDGNKIHYLTKNIWLGNMNFNLPIWLLPMSQWTEQTFDDKWKFHGTISLPKIIGGKVLMQYQGVFQPQLRKFNDPKKKVVIAGGSGLIGSIISKEFHKNGWKVDVLSRNKNKTMQQMPFATVHNWNPSKQGSKQNLNVLQHCLEDADVIINLSGQNPGKGWWTEQMKKRLINSRIDSINLLHQGLKLCSKKQRSFIQASAAGIYGDRHDELLNDQANSGEEKSWRLYCCKRIQEQIRKVNPNATIARVGHVFSSQDGFYPYIKLASVFGVHNLGSKPRYVPWIHVQDVAGAFYHCATNNQRFKGKQFNVTSPEHHTYQQILALLTNIQKIPAWRRISLPDIFFKVIFGQMSSVLLQSQRMHPSMLLETGYQFKFQNIQKAILSKECL